MLQCFTRRFQGLCGVLYGLWLSVCLSVCLCLCVRLPACLSGPCLLRCLDDGSPVSSVVPEDDWSCIDWSYVIWELKELSLTQRTGQDTEKHRGLEIKRGGTWSADRLSWFAIRTFKKSARLSSNGSFGPYRGWNRHSFELRIRFLHTRNLEHCHQTVNNYI